VDWPVGDCKGVHLKKPMLVAMVKYLDKMYEESSRCEAS